MTALYTNRRLGRLLTAVLSLSCLFSNTLPFLNIDLQVIILTPMRTCLLLISLYCLAVWLIRLFRREFRSSLAGCRMRLAVLGFMGLWSLCGVLWLVFGDCIALANTEVIGIITLFLYALCFFTLTRDQSDVRFCLRLLVLCGVVLALMADVEVVIGSFIEGSAYHYSLEERIALEQTLFPPSTVFTNTNDLSAFLLICLAVVIYRFITAKTKKEYILCSVTALILLSPTPVANSTIFFMAFGLLVVIAFLFILCCRNGTKKQRISKSVGLAAFEGLYMFPLCGAIKFLANKLNTAYFSGKIEEFLATHQTDSSAILDQLINKNTGAMTDTLLNQLSANQAGYGTIHIRWWLIRAGLDFSSQHLFLGCGPAGFRKLMDGNAVYAPQTRNIVDPHNFYIELLAQYGIFFFLAYLGILFSMLAVSVKRMLAEIKAGAPGKGVLVLLLLIAFSCAAIMPSGFIRFTPIWLPFFITVSAFEIKD